MPFYHLQKHVLEHGQMEMDKEPLLYEQAGRDNFCPDVVINSNCCKPPQPLQLPIGIRQRYASPAAAHRIMVIYPKSKEGFAS